jgi:RimJ/RimL family protein N-acetyltransferase
VILRRLTPEDATLYRELRLHALTDFPAAFMSSAEEERAESLDWFAQRLSPANDTTMLGAFDGQTLIGMVGFGRNSRLKTRHTGFIRSMFVMPAWRKAGVGVALLTEAVTALRQLDGLRQVYLEVLSGNAAAVALYQRLGFVQYGIQPDALCVDGELYDDMLMHLSLAAGAK